MEECYFYFTKINTSPWVIFKFFKFYKWYQIAQRRTYFNLSGVLWDFPKTFLSLLTKRNESLLWPNFVKWRWSFVVLRAIWYHSYNLKNVENTHGGVLILVNLQTEACNFTKSNTPPWVFFTLFKLCTWYQIAQNIKCRDNW